MLPRPRSSTLFPYTTLFRSLGQLTMTASSYAVTGPVIAGDSTDSIREGTVGNLLNMVGAEHVHEVQRIAVEQSRLGIPLRSEEHTSELQSRRDLVCRLLLEK